MTDRIGIIGGGVGGLAVAWNLHFQAKAKNQSPPEIHVFEKNDRFGGNADTKHFSFGKGPGYEDEELTRWSDMGVNDFNTAAYQNIVKVMDKIGYTKKNDNYKNLEDSTTYYNTKGHAFTANTYTPEGATEPVQDPWWKTAMDAKLYKSVASFMEIAGKDGDKEEFHDCTLEDYIKGNSKKHSWVPELGPQVIYPRVNGMYFTDASTGPRSMPFAAVMHYYKIQEGAGGIPADRNYFVGGASTWINALVGYMKTNMPEITFHTIWDAEVTPLDSGDCEYSVANMTKDATDEPITCGLIVLAAPANAALRTMKGGTGENRGLPAEAANIMAKIKYEIAVSVAHTDARLLPVNRNAWSTYNIVIHEPGSVALKPYVINYVSNRHQNDAADPDFNKFGLPQFFLSINPHIPVSEDKVLVDSNTGKPAIADLTHFVFDFACMQAQHDIVSQQGRAGIYYASGWTHGSGLHTECWTQGCQVAEMMLNRLEAEEEVLQDRPQSRGHLISSRLAASASTDDDYCCEYVKNGGV